MHIRSSIDIAIQTVREYQWIPSQKGTLKALRSHIERTLIFTAWELYWSRLIAGNRQFLGKKPETTKMRRAFETHWLRRKVWSSGLLWGKVIGMPPSSV